MVGLLVAHPLYSFVVLKLNISCVVFFGPPCIVPGFAGKWVYSIVCIWDFAQAP